MNEAFVDTNVLIRVLAGEPAEQARRATDLLARADPGTLQVVSGLGCSAEGWC